VRVFVLGSGSTGNCLIVEAEGQRLLLDAGIGLGRAVTRMRTLGADLVTSTPPLGVIVTHDHGDHAGHALPVARALKAPLWAHPHISLERARRKLDVRSYLPGKPFTLGPFLVEALGVPHDAPQVALRVTAGRSSIALATDLGHAPRDVRSFLAGSDLVFLESNYCPAMLDVGPYPPRLRSRVAGPIGHLANAQAAEVVASLAGTRAGKVILVHLSRANNAPARALEVVAERARGTEVDVLPHGEPRRFDVTPSIVRAPFQQLGFAFA